MEKHYVTLELEIVTIPQDIVTMSNPGGEATQNEQDPFIEDRW